jgi:hypothetical protein
LSCIPPLLHDLLIYYQHIPFFTYFTSSHFFFSFSCFLFALPPLSISSISLPSCSVTTPFPSVSSSSSFFRLLFVLCPLSSCPHHSSVSIPYVCAWKENTLWFVFLLLYSAPSITKWNLLTYCNLLNKQPVFTWCLVNQVRAN